MREGYTVEEILMDGDRVTGIRGHGKGQPCRSEHARVVIGADGKHSMVLKAVGAQEYNAKPIFTAGYYAYWRPRTQYAENKRDIEGTYLRTIASVPQFAELMTGATRQSRIVGTGDMPNAFRPPFGPGWALVGDAGYVKDPCTAQGISDSFGDAELLAGALHETLTGQTSYDQALGRYQRTRDKAVKRMYGFTAMLAPMDPLPGFVKVLFASMEVNQKAMDRFMGVFAGRVPVSRFFNPVNTIGIHLYRLTHRRKRPAGALVASPGPVSELEPSVTP